MAALIHRHQVDNIRILGAIIMFNNSDDQNKSNNGNDGFVWSQRVSVLFGVVIALALAVARFAPILAGPLEWQH
jgi:hypothetical protein